MIKLRGTNFADQTIQRSKIATSAYGVAGQTDLVTYTSIDDLPSAGNSPGDLAFVSGSTNKLYIWNGSSWYFIATVNNPPSITSIQDSDGNTSPFSLSADGIPTKITITATDSEGGLITFSAEPDSDFAGLATILQDSNEFTITPLSEDSATANSATVTFKVADGINISSSINTFTLAFSWVVDVSQITYDSVSFNFSSQTADVRGIAFNNDGTKMYIVSASVNTIYQYTLTTGFDLSTASYDSVTFLTNSQTQDASDMQFNNDGTKMFVTCYRNDKVYQYSLSTPYDISTASYDSVSYDPSDAPFAMALVFKPDGTKMYLTGYSSDTVSQHSLSTPYDLSTASFDNVEFDVKGTADDTSGLAFSDDGTKMYITSYSSGNERVYQYNLSTPYDVSTMSYDSKFFDLSSQATSPNSIAFSSDGTKMFIVCYFTDSVYQYSTGL